MVITATYSDNIKTETINSDYKNKGVTWEPETIKADTKEVTIKYQGKEATVTVTVNTITSIDASKYDLDELNSFLTANPSITEVDFSNVTDPIPEGVLNGTNVSKVIVSTTTQVDNAFSGVSGLTIEVTTGNHPTVYSSILGGASDVTLDLSRSGITYISGGTAINWNGLTSVKFPASLESINHEVFSNCSSLKSVDLSGCTSLESIENNAFSNCSSLERVDLSGCTNLNSIEDSAFSNCSSLESVDLSGCTNLECIEVSAFSDCSKLSRVILPSSSGTFRIGYSAFELEGGSSPLDLYIPHENTDLTVDYGAFSGRNVTVYYNGSNSNKITSSIENPGGGKVVDIKPYPSNP